ncbi:MAG: hypothetical protein HUK12_01960 [Muribaculaceae bacterium]|nr:hypothetical protein [Muribaculaceae bacterium]
MKYTDLKISDRIDILRNVQGKENLSCEEITELRKLNERIKLLPYSAEKLE